MGVKDLWPVLTPYFERKPISELRGKIVAIDLAGWVCESLNVVDYFVHPRHHLKNLFFRTCYLIWEEVTPVFVLEGTAPKLKSQVIAKRNELQFRGVKPRDKDKANANTQVDIKDCNNKKAKEDKGRTRFNYVLKQCEVLLESMGIQCVQGPGEAEAYCAFLNKKGLVDGVISQDSDCFAYGAQRVYRNFSVSMQGSHSVQGGAVDIYDMRNICQKMDFGQHKIIVMALLCGCDYCPDGVGGVGRDSVLKLFNKYKEQEILKRIRSWRAEDDKYTALEMRIDDKTICSNCGHIGRTQSHTKSGCGMCRTHRGCDESLWKEERLALKAELALRKKALLDPTFPSEEVIQEFLSEPDTVPTLNLSWKQPNIIKFIKRSGHLLQWPEVYCFQKFFPIVTRWQMRNARRLTDPSVVRYVEPKEIVKKRILKSVPSLEIVWQDKCGVFRGLLPDDQLKEFVEEHPKGIVELWTTVEPLHLVQEAYPTLVESFLKSKEKPKKVPKKRGKNKENIAGSLENLDDLLAATKQIAKTVKPRRAKKASVKQTGLQLIDGFFKPKVTPQPTVAVPLVPRPLSPIGGYAAMSSTPVRHPVPTDYDNNDDDENDISNLSSIVDNIVQNAPNPLLTSVLGLKLHYESMSKDVKQVQNPAEPTLDDIDLLVHKRNLSHSAIHNENLPQSKRMSLDDSFDVLVKNENRRLQQLIAKTSELLRSATPTLSPLTHVDRFKQKNLLAPARSKLSDHFPPMDHEEKAKSTSFFFDQSGHGGGEDVFEQAMELSFSRNHQDADDDL